MSHAAPPGEKIQVSPQRLLPMGTVGAFIAVGLLTFFALPVLLWDLQDVLARGAFRHRGVILVVHLYAVGWALPVAMGAWQQLSVVAFQSTADLHVRWSKVSLWAYLPGFALFLIGFSTSRPWAIASGGVLLIVAFIAMVAASIGAVRFGGRMSVIHRFAPLAQLSLVAVAVVGVMLAANYATGWLGARWQPTLLSHVFLGPLGWFGMLVPGVSYELGPFFGLTRSGSDKGRGKYGGLVAALLSGGLILCVAAVVTERFAPWAIAPIALGYLLFVYDLRGIYGPRRLSRRIPILVGVRFGHAYLAVVAFVLLLFALGVPVFHSPKAVTALGWLVAGGWLSNTLVAYLHRILPFLFWHHRYWGKPKEDVKTPFAQMVDAQLGRRGLWVYNIGVVATAAGIAWPWLLPWGIAAVALGTAALAFNLGRVYFR